MLARIEALVLLATWLVAASSQARSWPPIEEQIQLLYEFPQGVFLENLAVRPNGQILVTSLSLPQLWLVDPRLPNEAFLVLEIPGVLGLSGIVEYQADVYAVLAGNVSLATSDFGAGTWAVWSIDLNGIDVTTNRSLAGTSSARSSEMATIPEATFLEGLSVFEGDGRQLLIAGDVKTGVVYSIDVESREHYVVVNNTHTAPGIVPGFGAAGTDGLKVQGDMLYFSNAGQGLLAKVPLNAIDGTPADEFVVFATKFTSYDQWDDFTLDCEGNVFIATGGANTIQRVDQDGEIMIVAGNLNSTAIAEPTSAAFGRRKGEDERVLYVTTGGGVGAPVNGDLIIGGQVLAISNVREGEEKNKLAISS